MKKITSVVCMLSLLLTGIVSISYAENDSSIIFSENFESAAVGELPTKIGTENPQTVSYYQSGSNKPQNIISVEKDSKGSKALRFNIKTETADNNTTFTIPIGAELTEGSYEISYDVRIENNSRTMERLFQLWNKNAQSEIAGEMRWNYIFPVGYSDSIGGANGINLAKTSRDNYFSIKYMINMDTRTFDVYVDGNKFLQNEKFLRTLDSKKCGIDKIVFWAKHNRNFNGSDYDGTDNNPGIYWIDNIMIKKCVAKVTKLEPAANSVNISPDKPVTIVFDRKIDASTVNNETVKIYENNKELDKVYVDAACTDDTITVQKVGGGFDYGKSYEIKITNAVKVEGGGCSLDFNAANTSFSTESLVNKVVSIEDGKYYADGYIVKFPEIANVIYTLKLNGKDYGGEALSVGEYSAVLKAENSKNGKSEELELKFLVVGPTAPEANDVIISGTQGTGNVLTASYAYYDVNGDEEGNTKIQWVRSKNANDGFSTIPNANTLSYTLTEADEDCYIRVRITPVSKNVPYEGAVTESESFTGSFRPKARNVKITGISKRGETLVGSYEYFDLNEESENGTELVWVKADKKDGDYSQRLANQSNNSAVLGDDDVNCFIKFKVIPKNNGASKMNEEFLSEPFSAPFEPSADNVKIIGDSYVGSTLGASYTFFDYNSDKEGKSIIKWYQNNVCISDGNGIKVTKDMEGSSVYFEVIPVSEEFPYQGEAVKSPSVIIKAEKKVSFSGGGGGGASKPVDKEKETIDEKNEEENGTTGEVIFDDISQHWAKDSIKNLFDKRIINGVNEKEFKPDEFMTRAQLATVISNAFGADEEAECEFEDVSADDWYYKSVANVFAKEIMKGADGKFRPNDYLTREEIAVTLANLIDDVDTSQIQEPTDYEEISEWAYDSVKEVIAAGIITGYPDGTFMPKNNATRAEIAVMLERLLNMKGDENVEE